MRKWVDKKYFMVSLYVFCTAAAVLVFWQLVNSSKDLLQSFEATIRYILKILTPFIIAFFLAYILNPAIKITEALLCKILKNPKHKNRIKSASVVIIYLLLLAMLSLAIYYIVPGFIKNVTDLLDNSDKYINQVNQYYNELRNRFFTYVDLNDYVHDVILKGQEALYQWIPQIIPALVQGVVSVIGSLINIILGILLSIYIIIERENIRRGARQIIRILFQDRISRQIMSVLTAIDKVFGGFISSRLLISLIVFVLTQISFLIIGVKYSILMSIIVALTNLIPIIGPVLGAAAPVMVTFLDNPSKVLAVIIALFIIQAVEGYLITPRLTGDKMGLSPFWVLLVITLGGGFWGLWGVLLAVPIAAVIRLLVTQLIRRRAQRM